MGVSESMYPVRYNPSSTMLPDEEVVCRDYAEIRRADSFLSGTVFLTNYRLLFVEFSQVCRMQRAARGRVSSPMRRGSTGGGGRRWPPPSARWPLWRRARRATRTCACSSSR